MLLRSLNRLMLQESIPTDYFAPHLDVAIAALPALKLKDDAVEIDVLRVLGIGMGDAISAQKRSSNSGKYFKKSQRPIFL